MAGHDAIGILPGAGTAATSTQLRVAKRILESRGYRTVLASMLREKQGQLPKPTMPSAPTPTPANVINLMDVLNRASDLPRERE
jgi:hypothetical protein